MYRTHFHRQLAALYDAGNRQAIATQLIADAQVGSTEDAQSNLPSKLSNRALDILMATTKLIDVAFDGFAENKLSQSTYQLLLQQCNSQLAVINRHSASEHIRSILNGYSVLLAQFDFLFETFNSADQVAFREDVKARALAVLAFLLNVARDVHDSFSGSAPTIGAVQAAQGASAGKQKLMRKSAK